MYKLQFGNVVVTMSSETLRARACVCLCVRLTVISRHIHGYDLYEIFTLLQFAQKELRHVKQQYQIRAVHRDPNVHRAATKCHVFIYYRYLRANEETDAALSIDPH